jgi:UDP-N-acetylmuramate dehydrogenase
MPEVDPVPLARLTTLRTGAAPARMIDARAADELVDALHEVWSSGDEWFVLGGGSNLFVGDEPFDGTVVRILTRGIEDLPAPRPGYARLRIQAGHPWDDVVAHAVDRGLAGIAALSGIPGTAGAAPVQNVGAYGQEIIQTLVEVELLDESTGELSTVSASELGLGFRTSVLKHHYGSEPLRRAVIVSLTLELEDRGERAVAVPGVQLRTALGLDVDETITLRGIRERILQIRGSKGMVLDDADPDTYSAGSFFQNAVVSDAFARTLPDACPRWPVAPDPAPERIIPLDEYAGLVPTDPSPAPDVKVSSAWLIEHSGFGKGFRLPRSRAGLSTKHALALTNRGDATADELAELARFIRSRVHAEFGLLLQPEPVLIGVEI